MPHEIILKKDNVADISSEFEWPTSKLLSDTSTGTEITSRIDAGTEKPIKYQGKCR